MLGEGVQNHHEAAVIIGGTHGDHMYVYQAPALKAG
jgi:hypothetical protein